MTSQLLGNRGVNIPTGQSFANYVLLMVVYVPLLWYRGDLRSTLVNDWCGLGDHWCGLAFGCLRLEFERR